MTEHHDSVEGEIDRESTRARMALNSPLPLHASSERVLLYRINATAANNNNNNVTCERRSVGTRLERNPYTTKNILSPYSAAILSRIYTPVPATYTKLIIENTEF